MSRRHNTVRLGKQLHALLRRAVVGFTQYSIVPWLLAYLHSRKFESWSLSVVAYGLLLSVLNLGWYLGQLCGFSYKNTSKSLRSLLFLCLTSAYSSLAFVTRFPLFVLLFLAIGFCASALSCAEKDALSRAHTDEGSLSLDGSLSLPLSLFSPPSPSGSPTHAQNARTQDALEQAEQQALLWKLLVFSASCLAAAYLYDHSLETDFPCYRLSLSLTALCMLCTLGSLALRFLRRRDARSLPSLSASASLSARDASRAGASLTGHRNRLTLRGQTYVLGKVLDFADKGEVSAPVPVTGAVPRNFLSVCGGDEARAREMYGKCLAWRQRFCVDEICSLPQPSFPDVLQFYPHAIHGYSRDGCAVVYEILGKGDPVRLKQTGTTIDELVWHFNLRNEFVFTRVAAFDTLQRVVAESAPGSVRMTLSGGAEPSGDAQRDRSQYVPRLMTVIDVEGISMSSVTTDVLSFLQKSGQMIDNYYPEQVARIVVCKAPYWFSTIWSVIARALPEGVRQKVDILYDAKGLDKYIDPSQRPVSYGGTSSLSLVESPQHKDFLGLADQWAREHGVLEEDGGSNTASDKPMPSNVSSKSRGGAKEEERGGAAGSGKGMLQWLSGKFRRPAPAYLGEKNTYIYNATTGTWEQQKETEMCAADGQIDGKKSRKLSLAPPSMFEDDEDLGSDDIVLDAAGNFNGNNDVESGAFSPPVRASSSTSVFSVNLTDPSNREGERERRRRPRKGLSQAQIEEHGLVLAIHAAHMVSKGDAATVVHHTHSQKAGQTSPPRGRIAKDEGSQDDASASIARDSLADRERDKERDRDAAQLLLTVCGVHLCVSSALSLLLTLLPVWLCAPLRAGGLGFAARDLGLLLGTAALFTTQLAHTIAARARHWLRASPVRALRGACVVLFLSLCALPWYARTYTSEVEDILHHNSLALAHSLAASDATSLSVSLSPAPLTQHIAHLSAPHRHSSEIESVRAQATAQIIGYLSRLLPSQSLVSLLTLSLCLSLAATAAYIARRSASILLHVSLSSTLSLATSSVPIRYALHAMTDIFSPFLCALVSSLVYSARLRYPMNSAFFVWLCALLSLGAYLLSLSLCVRFRGDFGVVSDFQDLAALQYWREKALSMSFVKRRWLGVEERDPSSGGAGLHQRHTPFHTPLSTSSSSAFSSSSMSSQSSIASSSSLNTSSGIFSGGGGGASHSPTQSQSLWAVPLSDLALLLSHSHDGYGSKLHNLRSDFKDV